MAQTEAALDYARSQLDNSILTAPFAGVVASKNVEVGDMVNANTPICKITDNDKLFVEAYVSDRVIGYLEVGDMVEVQTDVMESKAYSGFITRIAPAADDARKSFFVALV
ncbi:efflux RND transporter periplasmic adaptor subunit [Desulfitispora alkaliphila]|uniref:efflux RND transporter periplasmic adaptor subunit n=1 Tax=Desulfitispora alkaliphila TaxID=622674 RepID=UPI003D259789